MSGQFNLFSQTTSKDSEDAISSAASQFGITPSTLPTGETAKSGPAPAPASPSARPVKAKRSTTKGIYGQSSFASSKHDDLSYALASRLRPLTDSLGSTLFALTWTVRVTPAGRSISALRASEPRTEDSVCIGWPSPRPTDDNMSRRSPEAMQRELDRPEAGANLALSTSLAAWPTPQSSDMTGGGQAKRSDGRANLNDFAMLAGWPTPVANDDNKTPEAHLAMKSRMGERDGTGANRTAITSLQVMAQLAGWKTPCVPNGGRISGNQTDIGKHQDGTKAQIGLENEAKLSGWTTPQAHDQTGRSKGQKEIHGTTHGCACLVSEARLGAWPTPMAETPAQKGYNEAGNNDSSRKTVEMCQWPTPAPGTLSIAEQINVARSTDSGETPIGYLLGPNGWEIVPASGQLNASHSRWLMGLPAIWDQAAIAAFRSLKARKRGLRGSVDTEME